MDKAKRKAIIAGNWKMNKTASEAAVLVDEMIPKETTTEKTTVSGWRGQLDRLWKWGSQKEDDAQ